MIIHTTGDLLDFPEGITVIAHCANCRCTLGNHTATGIAKLIGDRYPAAAQADKEAFDKGEARLGQFSVARLEDGRRIVNFYGQDAFGNDRRYLNYEAIYTAMDHLRDLLEMAAKDGRPYKLGLPYLMGCNRAGGKWPVVEAMIESLFGNSPIDCFIVHLK